MPDTNTREHWEKVYETKQPDQLSWTQHYPETSLEFIHGLDLPKTAGIIDIGGGDSALAGILLEEGFQDITVLDISAHALDRAKSRLGEKASRIQWIVSDITEFQPTRKYDLWHDRATFHFLVDPEQSQKYIDITRNTISKWLIIAGFSKDGPQKCSGLTVNQYDEESLSSLFADGFRKIKCFQEDHITPFGTRQNFLFCSFEATVAGVSR